MTAVIDLHLVRAACASGHDLKAAIAQAGIDQERCRDIQVGDSVATPEGNKGRVLFIWSATRFSPTMALVQIDWFRRCYPLKDLQPARNITAPQGHPREPGLAGGGRSGDN